MPRSCPEWIAKHDDQAIPGSVKDRIALKAEDYCQSCKRKVGQGGLRAEFDHVTPLILGGKHCEANLQLLCHECHGKKTKLDVKLKAKVARVRKKHLGLVAPRKKIPSKPFPSFKKQHSASRRIEKWSAV